MQEIPTNIKYKSSNMIMILLNTSEKRLVMNVKLYMYISNFYAKIKSAE